MLRRSTHNPSHNVLQISFREANQNDDKLLFDWRNDPETRRQSRSTDEVSWEEHTNWFARSLERTDRQIVIAEDADGTPIGTVRLDTNEDGTAELSWSVAPEMRGQGYGTAIVQLFVEQYTLAGQSLIAEIRHGNTASQKIAAELGMKKVDENEEFQQWRCGE